MIIDLFFGSCKKSPKIILDERHTEAEWPVGVPRSADGLPFAEHPLDSRGGV